MKMLFNHAIMKWVVCITAALFFAYELAQLHMLNAISPMLMRDLQLNGTQLSYLSSSYLLADALFLLPAGIILDRFSPRKVILTALALCIFGTFAFAMSHSLFTASICHFISGIGNAFCFLSCMILISRWFPVERHALVMGLMITIGMFGAVLAQTPFSLLAQNSDWRTALLIDGCIGLALLLLVFLLVHNAPKAEEETVPAVKSKEDFFRELKLAFKSKQTVFCGIYTALMNLPLMLIGAVWGSLFLTQIHGLTLKNATFITSMVPMGTILGSTFVGWLSDKTGKRKTWMLVGGQVSLFIIALIMFYPSPSYFHLLIWFFLLGLFSSTQVLGYPMISESCPRHLTGTSIGIAGIFIIAIATLAQPLSGKLLDFAWDGSIVNGVPFYSYQNFALAFSIFPIGFVLSLAALLLIKEPKRLTAQE